MYSRYMFCFIHTVYLNRHNNICNSMNLLSIAFHIYSILFYSILFYSILFYSILQAAPCSSTSIFAFLWFCVRDLFHQDPHYRFDWIRLSLMHTVFLFLARSLFLSLCIAISFFLIFLLSFHCFSSFPWN